MLAPKRTAVRVGDIYAAAVSPQQAADLLGVSRQHIYNLIASGQLRRYHVGRCVRIPTDDVLSLVGGGHVG